jgi:hypothetical protein
MVEALAAPTLTLTTRLGGNLRNGRHRVEVAGETEAAAHAAAVAEQGLAIPGPSLKPSSRQPWA